MDSNIFTILSLNLAEGCLEDKKYNKMLLEIETLFVGDNVYGKFRMAVCLGEEIFC